MDINATLLGEMLTFAVLVWATMKYIWPPLTQAMQERQQKIAAGLEAAQCGQNAMELAQKNVAKQLQEAKNQAAAILDQANQQANTLIEEGRIKAQEECANILARARMDIEQEISKTKLELQQQTADLVIAATEKILQQKIDEPTQQKLIDQLITEI
ncbi:MAG: ATP synthase F0, B subunit [uncultured bacterium]|nr:MAG: ATP synthase F0, B subunit [uncultured bacterium]